jgi:protein-arginine kinase activator protein McsA
MSDEHEHINRGDSITCPQCGMTSYHDVDIEMGFCANCGGYTSPVDPIAMARRFLCGPGRAP